MAVAPLEPEPTTPHGPPDQHAISAGRRSLIAPPQQLSRFIGRSRELAEAGELLGRARLLTLTGPGGAGKSRLAVELARLHAPEFPDGVAFASLEELRDAAQLPDVVARSVGLLPGDPTRLRRHLCDSLANRRMLLLLDNFEQLLDGAGLIGEILAAAAGVKVIATSRAPLCLFGEQEFPLGPLEPPSPDAVSPESLATNPAVALFVDRAQAVDPDFRLELHNAGAVARLCRQLDGLPLAIELAAARIRLFSPAAMAERMSRRFDLLSGGARHLPERQRTLRRAILCSYELLDEPGRRLFRRLSVFDGGMTLEAAQALCDGQVDCEAHALDILSSLADHSMLQRRDQTAGDVRFAMLESIRALGLELLRAEGEEASVRRLHAEYFLGFAEEAKPHLTGPDQAEWFDRLDADHANFRAALEWAGSPGGEPLIGIRAGAALWRYWLVRGRLYEGRPLLEALLAKPPDDFSLEPRIDALYAIGSLCHYQGEYELARRRLSTCVELARQAGDRHRLGHALAALAWVHCLVSEFAECHELSEQARLLFEDEGDIRGVAIALNNCGWADNYIGDYPSARACHERGLALRREVGDIRGQGFSLTNLAWAERIHGDFERASKLLDQAEETLARLDDKVLSGWALIQRAQVERDRGRFSQAAGILVEALASWGAGGHRALLAWTHGVLGAVLLDWGEPERGRELLTESLRQWQSLECPWAVAWIRYEQGRWMLGRQSVTARRLLRESLEMRARIGDRRGVAESVEALLECPKQPLDPLPWLELYHFAATERAALQAPAPASVLRRLDRMRAEREAVVGQLGEVLLTAEEAVRMLAEK